MREEETRRCAGDAAPRSTLTRRFAAASPMSGRGEEVRPYGEEMLSMTDEETRHPGFFATQTTLNDR
jgi:hypothetical protein